MQEALADLAAWLWGVVHSDAMKALAGAVVGAVITNMAVWRSEQGKEIRAEVRNLNAAITVAIEICKTAMNMKNQFVREANERLDKDRKRLEEFRKDPKLREQVGAKEPHFALDLSRWPVQIFPAGQLQTICLEKLTATGRPVGLSIILVNSVDALTSIVEDRNRLCDEFNTMPKDDQLPRYLGFAKDGVIDARFPLTIEHSLKYLDDIGLFSSVIVEDLTAFGNQLRSKAKWKLIFGLPTVVRADFTEARKANLIPDKKDYSAILDGYKSSR